MVFHMIAGFQGQEYFILTWFPKDSMLYHLPVAVSFLLQVSSLCMPTELIYWSSALLSVDTCCVPISGTVNDRGSTRLSSRICF